MGYFEGLTSGSFKTSHDGRKLFFPWGALGRGYVLASEDDERSLRSRVKAWMVVNMLLTMLILLAFPQRYAILAAWVLISTGFYLAWLRFLLRRLDRADERLSFGESMTSQANAYGPAVLWFGTIASLVFVLGGILLFLSQSDQSLVGLAGVAFFGLCAAMFIRMLVLRHRTEQMEA